MIRKSSVFGHVFGHERGNGRRPLIARRGFYAAWMVLGGAQLIAFGCGNVSASDAQLLSNSPEARGTTDEAGEQARPVRISREFLKDNPGVDVAVISASGAQDRASGATSWHEYPTKLPPPGDDALADFRDFEGCAVLVDGAKICFNVMPDVSSVGANSREMSLQGFEARLAGACGAAAGEAVTTVRSATRVPPDSGAAGIESRYDIVVDGHCGGRVFTINLGLVRS